MAGLATIGNSQSCVFLQCEKIKVGDSCHFAVGDVLQFAAGVVYHVGTAVYGRYHSLTVDDYLDRRLLLCVETHLNTVNAATGDAEGQFRTQIDEVLREGVDCLPVPRYQISTAQLPRNPSPPG